MLHDLELQLIDNIHQFRTPLLDGFFKFLDHFDTPEFFFFLIPIIWLGHGWKAGLRLFYMVLLSGFFNMGLKALFSSPRPFEIDPSVGLIFVKGHGFPSGAAQTVILLSGLLLYYARGQWKWAVAISYVLLISFSRIYLGVHFPTDILGGWLVGFVLLGIYFYIRPPIERQLDKLNDFSLLILSIAVPLLLILFEPRAFRFCCFAMGLGIGLFIAQCYHLLYSQAKNAIEYTLRCLIGVLGTFVLYEGPQLFLDPKSIFIAIPQYLMIGLWISLGANLVTRNLFKTSAVSNQTESNP